MSGIRASRYFLSLIMRVLSINQQYNGKIKVIGDIQIYVHLMIYIRL